MQSADGTAQRGDGQCWKSLAQRYKRSNRDFPTRLVFLSEGGEGVVPATGV